MIVRFGFFSFLVGRRFWVSWQDLSWGCLDITKCNPTVACIVDAKVPLQLNLKVGSTAGINLPVLEVFCTRLLASLHLVF